MDLHEVLNNLQLKAVGLKPSTRKAQKGYFVSFREIGLPIREKDFDNPLDLFSDSSRFGDDFDDDLGDDDLGDDDLGDDDLGDDDLSDDDLGDDDDLNGEKKPERSPEMNYKRTFDLTNEKLIFGASYAAEPSAQQVHNTWKSILDGATLDLDQYNLDDEAEKKFEKVEKILTPEYKKKVSIAMQKYDEALERLVEKYTEYILEGKRRQWLRVGKIYQRKLKRARDNYKIVAKKYSQAKKILRSNGIDPSTILISRAKDAWDNWEIQLGDRETMPYNYMSPSDWYDPDSSGWNTYNEHKFSYSNGIETSKTGISGGLKLSLGLWSVGGGGGGETTKKNIDVDTENLEIDFSYCIVKVHRPWMDTGFLKAKNWYLKSSSINNSFKKNCISDGTYSQEYENKDDLFLPSIVTSLILVKDVKVTWKKSELDIAEVNKVIKAGGSIGWGPIKLKGGYSKGKDSKEVELDERKKELSSSGVQLIGYVSQILPASPYMDSKVVHTKEEIS